MKTIFLQLLVWLHLKLPNSLLDRLENLIATLDGGHMWSERIRHIYARRHKIQIGYGSYGGCFTPRNLAPGVRFGNYCSIAPSIKIFRANHPKDTFTSHPILYNPSLGFVKNDMLNRPSLEIGHDVWIGEWTVILPNVKTIGNGSIIGAGSVVTKDVAPYTIVAGNPARKIKSRFDTATIQTLENSKWWLLEKEELFKNINKLNSMINFSQLENN